MIKSNPLARLFVISGNVLTNFQLQQLKGTLIFKWTELGTHKLQLTLIVVRGSSPQDQPSKPGRGRFDVGGRARAYSNANR